MRPPWEPVAPVLVILCSSLLLLAKLFRTINYGVHNGLWYRYVMIIVYIRLKYHVMIIV